VAKFDLQAYARRGAEARVAELQQELDGIYSAFPDLRANRGGRPRKATSTQSSAMRASTAGNDDATPRRRNRKPMTAAQRKAVGERMRKYWAARRAGGGAKKR
jgi:hypothetical protein